MSSQSPPSFRFIRSVSLVSSLTMLSRVLGLVRMSMMAKVFGLGAVIDCSFWPLCLPIWCVNFLGKGPCRRLLFPNFPKPNRIVKTRSGPNGCADGLTALVLCCLLLVALGCAALNWVPMSSLFFFVGEDSLNAVTIPGESYATTLQNLLLILWPYLLLICLVATLTGILQSEGRFLPPALSPVVLNIAWIGGLLWAPAWGDQAIYVMAWSILAGGLLQLALVVWPVMRLGYSFRPLFNFRHPDFQSILIFMGPVILGLLPPQLSLLVDLILAEAQVDQSGAVSSLQYANRLFQLPLALVGIAVATVAFPKLSYEAGDDRASFKETLGRGGRLVLFWILPALCGMAFLASDIVGVLYQRGQFDGQDTQRVSAVLRAYVWGLPAMSLLPLMTRAFYACHDSKTPIKAAFWAMLIKVTLSLLWVRWQGEQGLAMATSTVAWVQLFMLLMVLRRQQQLEAGWWRRQLGPVLSGCLVMCVALWWGQPVLADALSPLWSLAGAVLGGAMIYLIWLRFWRP